MQEKWVSLKGIVYLGDFYEINNFGNVRSIDRFINNVTGKKLRKGKNLIPQSDKDGYHYVQFYLNGKRKAYRVHRLVAYAFLKNEGSKPSINHIDGVKSNNYLINLEWSTEKENIKHAFETGLHAGVSGEESPNSILKDYQVKEIYKLYKSNSYSMIELSEKFLVSVTTIHNIVNRITWKHLELGEKISRDIPKSRVATKEIISQVKYLYETKKYSKRRIEREVGISRTIVTKIIDGLLD